jgi:hypothetical protein
MNVVTPFGRIESVRMVPYRAQSSFVIGLIQNGTRRVLRGVYFEREGEVVIGPVQDWIVRDNVY